MAKPKKEEENRTAWKDQWSSLSNIKPFLKLIWQTSIRYTLLSLLLRLVRAAIPTLSLYVGKLIIDEVILLVDGGGSGTFLWQMVAVEFGLAVLNTLLGRSTLLIDGLLSDLVANRTSVEIMQKAARLDLFFFEQAEFYDKLERARTQTRGRAALLGQILAQIQDVITLVFLGIGVVAFSPWLIGLLVIAVVPGFIQENYFNQRSYSLTRNWTPERRELDYLRYIGTSDVSAKEVKIFGLSDFISNKFAGLADQYYQANRKLSMRRAAWGVFFGALATLAYYGAYVLIIQQTIAGGITIGTLTFLAGSFRRMQQSLQGVLTRFSKIAEGALYLQDYYDFMAIESKIQDEEGAIEVPKQLKIGWEFERVSFKYPGAENWAIHNLSIKIPAGQKVALVGENGAGKTTMVKLLARLYEPTEGRILLEGIDLRKYKIESLRDNVGLIFQDFFRYQLSLKDNIAIGQIDRVDDMERIVDSAEKSLAVDVVDRLPDGYEQLLGKRFRGGTELSGGQWQKIALARAYMREAQLLILDEPTSALDARAEYEIFLKFSDLMSGKSAILISHRFSTVRMADKILFLEYGQLVEAGSHDELLVLNGKYAELFELQAAGYQ
ncbi:MAG: ABC transporter ATP-binding protein [Bacteroidota bacterium]